MKTITIKEPYATLIAKGIKKYEFRSWNTNYRGDIYIHAGKTYYQNIKDFNYKFRPSEIVAIATIVDVIKLNEIVGQKIHEMNPAVYGFNSDGYAWVLSNVRPINSRIKVKGKLGFWNYEL